MGDVISSTLPHVNNLPIPIHHFQHSRLRVKKNRFNVGSTLGCPYSPQNNIRNFEHSHFHFTEAINVNGIHLYLIYLIYNNSNIKTTFPVSHLLIHVCLMAFLLSHLPGALDTTTNAQRNFVFISSSYKSVNRTIMLFHFNDFLIFLSFSPAFANIFFKRQ